MHRISINTAPPIFHPKFKKQAHKYTTRFSKVNYKQPKHKLNFSKHAISNRGPSLWNKFLTNKEKHIDCPKTFQLAVKSKLLELENEFLYF